MPSRLATAISQGNPKLLDQVRDVIRRKQYSIRTEQAYIYWRVKASAHAPRIIYHI